MKSFKNCKLATTRFSNRTWAENKKWRAEHDWGGCIYGCPIPIAHADYRWKIDKNERIFVIEMNNETNQVEGIGCILNHMRYDLDARIYSDFNYNRYIYRSNVRITRDKIEPVLDTLENILFKGKGHLKRGHGITIHKSIFKKCIMFELKNGVQPSVIIRRYKRFKKILLQCLS